MKYVQNVKFITMLFGANSDAMLQSVFGKFATGVPYYSSRPVSTNRGRFSWEVYSSPSCLY